MVTKEESAQLSLYVYNIKDGANEGNRPLLPIDWERLEYQPDNLFGFCSPLLHTGDGMTTEIKSEDDFTQPCRRTRRVSVPDRLRARGLGACGAGLRWRQQRDVRSSSVASANWLRRSGTATRHVCGLGGSGGEQYEVRDLHFMRVAGLKELTWLMDSVFAASRSEALQ